MTPVDLIPDTYTDAAREYEAIAHAAGILDLPHAGVLRLSGGDRVRFLNAMVTQDVATLPAGRARPALLATTKGKMVAELLVLSRADDLLVLVLQGPVARVVEALESHIIADDVALEDLSGAHGVVAIEGPKSRDLVWRIFAREPLPLEPLAFTENEYQGMRATVLRHSVAGGRGMLVIVDREHLPRMREYLVQGGIGMDAFEVGRAAWNTRRIESGLPWFGADIGEDNFPAECGLDASHVSFEKGCYLGQETIARMHHRGHPNWRLVGLSTASADVPPTGTSLFTDDESTAVGRVTSAALSPVLKRPLCLAFVRAPLAVADTRFHARVGGEIREFTIVQLPLKGEADARHA
jgi:folate-binding protein YgfZ